MRFKAENFEATATEIEGAGDSPTSTWAVESPGNAPHTIRRFGGDHHTALDVLRETGWLPLAQSTKPRPLEKDLATAIAVLYSVPGVVCVEEPTGAIVPTLPTRFDPGPDDLLVLIDENGQGHVLDAEEGRK